MFAHINGHPSNIPNNIYKSNKNTIDFKAANIVAAPLFILQITGISSIFNTGNFLIYYPVYPSIPGQVTKVILRCIKKIFSVKTARYAEKGKRVGDK